MGSSIAPCDVTYFFVVPSSLLLMSMVGFYLVGQFPMTLMMILVGAKLLRVYFAFVMDIVYTSELLRFKQLQTLLTIYCQQFYF